MRSFRAFEVQGETVFWEKARYIHNNSVEAGLVERAADYRWSSARLYDEGLWDPVAGLTVGEY
ncbi:MAG: hypothetical protein HUU60_11540 [Armatimonadetes bacterium]|nr:hypothetical protein [Armatimonadota bacterium]